MTPNHPYDSMSLLSFQVSMLSLATALDDLGAEASKELATVALGEAEQLKDRMNRLCS